MSAVCEMIKSGIIKMLPFWLTFFFGLLFLSNYTYFTLNDSEDMLNLSVAMYEMNDLAVGVKVNQLTGETQKVYSKYGLGLPLFLTPFHFLNDAIYFLFGFTNSNLILSLSNLLIIALLAQVLFILLSDFGVRFKKSLFLSLSSVFGTFMFPYINFFLSEPLQGLCLITTLLSLCRGGNTTRSNARAGYIFLGGLTFCFGVLTKAAFLIFCPFFFIYILVKSPSRDVKSLLRLSVFFLIPLIFCGLIMAYINYYRFGSIFDFGYGDESGLFVNPVLSGLYNEFFNPNKSFFIFAPVFLLFPFAIWKFAKQYRWEGTLILFIAGSNLILYSAWWAWEGAATWGPRFLLILVPILFVPLHVIPLKKKIGFLMIFLLGGGFLINLTGVIQDFVGYDYIVIKATNKINIEINRLNRDYYDNGTYLQPPPYVVSSTLYPFNVITGNIWLLKAKYTGWKEGYGMTNENKVLFTPPWAKAYPQFRVPDMNTVPPEIKIRIECPPPFLLSSFLCRDRKPSIPYYFKALTFQAVIAETLGNKEKSRYLNEKAGRERSEMLQRTRQMSL